MAFEKNKGILQLMEQSARLISQARMTRQVEDFHGHQMPATVLWEQFYCRLQDSTAAFGFNLIPLKLRNHEMCFLQCGDSW